MRVLFALLLIPVLSVSAQNDAAIKKADTEFDRENYSVALSEYLEIYKTDSLNANLQYKIGECYLHSAREKGRAIPYLEQAVQKISKKYNTTSTKEKNAPSTAYLLLGNAYQKNYQFDMAISMYESYLNDVPADSAYSNRLIDQCIYAKILIANPVDLIVANISKTVNGPFPDYAPVMSVDEKILLFTSRREGSIGGIHKDEGSMYREDIYMSTKGSDGEWGPPKNIANINSEFNEATVGLSVDGQQVLFYSDKTPDGNGDIYISKLNGDEWGAPIMLPSPINSKSQEPDACFSADGNILYFVSDRKGGYGGFDIYMVKRLPNGEWSFPQNLGGKINTPYNDRAPFMHPDGVTLFFCSEGHKTMGGYDIFQSMQDENGVWTDAENIGYPINTTDDDVFYGTSADGKRSYYSSFREDGFGEKDIYLITLPKKAESALTVMGGVFRLEGSDGKIPENAQIVVTDNETGEIIGIYKPNSKTGKYLFVLPAGKNYNVTYEAEGYLFKSENLIVPEKSEFTTIQSEIKLAPIEAGQNIILNNIFFDFDKATITPESKTELDKLFRLLVNNPSMKVEIQGHTDSKGDDGYNKRLSQERSESVVKYLVERSIPKSQLSAKGYGETQPIAKNTNNDGSDNPEGRKLNRRTEMKILSTTGNPNIINDIYVPENLKIKEEEGKGKGKGKN
ncbi:MAG: OmpA family protein [Bacteroidetes bacterium]|nr:OmpA family protein [Bacteroidota bacterium]